MSDLAPGLTAGRPRQIIAAARTLLEEEGAEALTMRRLADRVGVKARYYKHFPDKSSVVTALASRDAPGDRRCAGGRGAGPPRFLRGARHRLPRPRTGPPAPLPPHHGQRGPARGGGGRAAAPLFRAAGHEAGRGRPGRSPTAWWSWSSTAVSSPEPTSRPPGRPVSRPSQIRAWKAPGTMVHTADEPAGRPRGGPSDPRRGTSGLHRAGWWLTATRGDPRDSATENRPPGTSAPGKGETVV